MSAPLRQNAAPTWHVVLTTLKNVLQPVQAQVVFEYVWQLAMGLHCGIVGGDSAFCFEHVRQKNGECDAITACGASYTPQCSLLLHWPCSQVCKSCSCICRRS